MRRHYTLLMIYKAPMMLRLQTRFFSSFLALLISLLVSAPASAYVVVEMSSRDKASSDSGYRSKAKRKRATGTVYNEPTGESAGHSHAHSSYSGHQSENRSRRNPKRSKAWNLDYVSYRGSDYKSSNGNKSKSRSRGRRQSKYSQVVNVRSSSTGYKKRSRGAKQGRELPDYDPGKGQRGRSSQAGNGGNGGGGGGRYADKYPNSKPDENKPNKPRPRNPNCISGTPEPAAIAVWAIAGCCGFTFYQCRRKWFPENN